MDKSGEKQNSKGISRRSFLKGAGLATMGAVATTALDKNAYAENSNTKTTIIPPNGILCTFKINNKSFQTKVEPRMTLAEVLRDHLHLTGTKVVCDRGACGACTVILDGKTVTSCMILALDAVGKSIETIEGLEIDNKLHPLQESFVKNDALQCGFCTPGMIMSCKNLLDNNSKPTLEDVRHAVRGNLCRCGTYPKVFSAVLEASGKKGE